MPTDDTSLKRVHRFRDKWRWPEDVERFVRERCESPSLYVCAGQSPLGDVSLDADAKHQPDVQAAMTALPFRDATFQTVIADPPWKSVDVFDRHRLFYELVRVTKPQGKIIHNATWVPESDQCEVLGEYRRQDGSFRDASVISVHERYPGQQEVNQYV
jgi:hypothetical protein